MSDGKRYRMISWATDPATGSRSINDIWEFDGPLKTKRGYFVAFLTHMMGEAFEKGHHIELKELPRGTD